MNVALHDSLVKAMRVFLTIVSTPEWPIWMHMIKMIELVCCTAEGPFAEAKLQHIFSNMEIGGVFI
jgi:hypothetical protein